MTDYTNLVKALRHCYEDDDACATCQRWLADDEWGIKCKGRLISDAAAAIEELQAEVQEAFNRGYNAGYVAGVECCTSKLKKELDKAKMEDA